MSTAFDASIRQEAPLRALVLARGGTFRRVLMAALGELPGVTVLGAFSSSEPVLDRARRNEVDVLFVDPDDIDTTTFGKAISTIDRPPEWFAVTGSEGNVGGAAAHALLLGAAGVIQRPPSEDVPALRARLRTGLGPRLPESARPRRGTLPPPRVAPAPALASYGGSTPVPMTGRIVLPTPARRELLAIGCSTGGPPAVASLIQALPASFKLPICLVQHMSAQHMSFFVEGLSRQLTRPVHTAQDQLALTPGHVYVAAGDTHMLLERDFGSGPGEGLRLRLSHAAPEHNCRPAVDPFFRSVATTCGAAAIGVVLTGMGSDGALGGKAMRDGGAPVLAQNAETSVVWGMPGATYQVGAACAVLPLEQLPAEILLWTMHMP